jgi:DNA-directed RNA polymerase specialized sigma24 family protein
MLASAKLQNQGIISQIHSFINRIGNHFTASATAKQVAQSATAQAASQIDLSALQGAVEQLPEGYRTVYLLHDVYGFNHEKIAEKLGISTTSSRSQLGIARLNLRALLLKNNIITSTANCREMLTA